MEQLSGALQSNLSYVCALFAALILSLCVYNSEILAENWYFNARFDDVMLIVKHEMASLLRGPLPKTFRGYFMLILVAFQLKKLYMASVFPGKSNAGCS